MRVLTICPVLPKPGLPGSMAPAARQFASLRAAGIEMDILEVRGHKGFGYLAAMPRVREMARKVDLVHAHYGFCGLSARAQHDRPLVVSFMGSDLLGTFHPFGIPKVVGRLGVSACRWLAPRSDAVIVKSAHMASTIPNVPSHIVPNGVNLDHFRPLDQQESRNTLGWNVDATHILFPGDPGNPRKNYRLAKKVVDHASKKLGRPLTLNTLWGVAPDQVPLYMNASDAMLMMSLREGSPNVVKEAMACDLPVVSVPVGDTTELLDGVAGSHVCSYDASELGDALTHVLADGVVSTGRSAMISKGLDLDGVAQKVINIYKSVLGESPCDAASEMIAAPSSKCLSS